MDKFMSVYPHEKPALRLEDFRKFSLKEHQGILKHYHENISQKTHLLLRAFIIFCHFQSKSESTVPIRFINEPYYLMHL